MDGAEIVDVVETLPGWAPQMFEKLDALNLQVESLNYTTHVFLSSYMFVVGIAVSVLVLYFFYRILKQFF